LGTELELSSFSVMSVNARVTVSVRNRGLLILAFAGFPAISRRRYPARSRSRLWLPVFLGGLLQLVQPGIIVREFREVGQGDLRGQDLVVVRDVR